MSEVGRDKPNVLYILSDQHSAAVLGAAGDPVVDTPALDGLAAAGVRFENTYCPAPICVPSRMAMMTGRHAYRNEVWTNFDAMNSSLPTFAHAAGTQGYRPTLIGRLHAIGGDQMLGYAERIIGDVSPAYSGVRGPDFGVLRKTSGPDAQSLRAAGIGMSGYQVYDEDVVGAAVAHLRSLGEQARNGALDHPFFVSIGLMLPHQPFVASESDFEKYRGRVTMPVDSHPDPKRLHIFARWWREHTGIDAITDDEIILRARTAYWALVDRVDQYIGRILDELDASGLAENTLVVYTSDHGEQAGEHGLWWKHTLYEGSTRVPLIMRWPGVLPEGEVNQRVVSALDVTATLVEATGAPPLPNTDGRSLLGIATGGTAWVDEAFVESCTDSQTARQPDYGDWYQRSIRSGNWKLNYYHGAEPELFDLHEDPHELRDRAHDPECRDTRERLLVRVLDGWDPDAVRHRMLEKVSERDIFTDWAEAVSPPEPTRWQMTPEMNQLVNAESDTSISRGPARPRKVDTNED